MLSLRDPPTPLNDEKMRNPYGVETFIMRHAMSPREVDYREIGNKMEVIGL
jgi:hypothetical protein